MIVRSEFYLLHSFKCQLIKFPSSTCYAKLLFELYRALTNKKIEVFNSCEEPKELANKTNY